MRKVKFTNPWRGYQAGEEAELTDERADELEAAGYFEAPKKPAKKTNAASKSKSTGDKSK